MKTSIRQPKLSEANIYRSAATLCAVLAAFAATLVWVPVASAERLDEISQKLQSDGVYVAPSRGDIDEDELVEVVLEYKFEDLEIGVVAPRDPEPNAKAFARRVQEKTNMDGVIVFVDDGKIETHVSDTYASAEIRATERALAAPTPKAAVQRFANELPKEGQAQVPAIAVFVGFLMAMLIGALLYIGNKQNQEQQAQSESSS